jgi:hypothetical protein
LKEFFKSPLERGFRGVFPRAFPLYRSDTSRKPLSKNIVFILTVCKKDCSFIRSDTPPTPLKRDTPPTPLKRDTPPAPLKRGVCLKEFFKSPLERGFRGVFPRAFPLYRSDTSRKPLSKNIVFILTVCKKDCSFIRSDTPPTPLKSDTPPAPLKRGVCLKEFFKSPLERGFRGVFPRAFPLYRFHTRRKPLSKNIAFLPKVSPMFLMTLL